MMSDYIDRQAAIDAALISLTKRERKNLLHTWSTVEVKYWFVDLIERLPSADVVEVVRCKDCKYNPNDTWFDCPIANLPYKEDRWCWKGERRDE